MALVAPYPGILETLQALKEQGMQLGVLSNKPDNMAQYIVGDLFGGLIHQAHGQRAGIPTKPDPTAVLHMAADFGVDPSRVLYVGDSGVDMQTGRNAGMHPCGVLWGFSFIIPGMTSSSILMAVGLLTPLIDGIAQLDFTVLVPWGLGMVGVMVLFARIVSRLFDTHYSIACHAVIGIVLASTLIIIPTGFASTAEMVWSVACAILGAVLAYFGSKLQPQEDAEIEAK